MNKQILKVLVGSRAHGLHNEDSDYDFRGVFVLPTSTLLKLGKTRKHTAWIEDKTDDTSWEIGKFLHLATKCNPTILETFLSPKIYQEDIDVKDDKLGNELRSLFPYIWNSKGVLDSFIGYGMNQQKKFLANKDNRADKYATAYLRTLYNAYELLSTGELSINMSETPIFDTLKSYKSGEYEVGDVIQTCFDWEKKVIEAYDSREKKEANLDIINEFLLKVRKEYWK